MLNENQNSNPVQNPNQTKKTMKLAPMNFPGKALVFRDVNGSMILGDENDENAVTIFVEGNHIYNAN